jgi:Cu(I)/Ag(I) efflux system membrane fusion protein
MMRTAIFVGVVAALSGSAAFADTLTPAIVDPAVAIQKSLANDSMASVQANAATIEEQAAKLGAPAAKIAEAAKELKTTTKIEDARTAFGRLSEAIVGYVDAHKLTFDPPMHIAYCPMVNKPWLQAGDTIANPYYGKQMPTCGSFKK